MIFLTSLYGGKFKQLFLGFVGLILTSVSTLHAQPETNTDIPDPGQLAQKNSTSPATNVPAENAPPAAPSSAETPAPTSSPASVPPPPSMTEAPPATTPAPPLPATVPASVMGALLTFASLGGFLLYYCGLTRAKNSGHTCTLLLVGVLFGLTGYWIGGFAVQTGGVGDVHAALAQPIQHFEKSALDHELGFLAFGHHWNFMGSSGFFLATDDASRNGIALLFLVQAAMLAVALAAGLGAALERGKVLAMAFCSYLIGVLVYPLLANWIWGGGWLAALGTEFHLGNGVVDLGGAEVVHLTAGTLALVLAVALGPRHGRFGRNQPSFAIPGHNVPFIVVGSLILLVSWMAANAFAAAGLAVDPALPDAASTAGIAATNTLLAAMGGTLVSFIQAAVQKQRPEPARVCRGLLGGTVASCGCAGLVDPWAAFVIGGVAGFLVQAALVQMERKRLDDPVGAAAVHGAGGAWGVIATGLFANGSAGLGLNGVPQTVRGLFFGGAWHQLAAQIIGCAVGFAVIYLLGYACVSLVQKILGNRADLAEETKGLDWSEVGALGYQGDVEPEE